MKVLVISKNDLIVIEHFDVLNISFTSTAFSITNSGTTYTYLKEDYILQILW